MKLTKKTIGALLIGVVLVITGSVFWYTRSNESKSENSSQQIIQDEQRNADSTQPTVPETPNQSEAPSENPESPKQSSTEKATGTQTVTVPVRNASIDSQVADAGKEFISTSVTFTNTSNETIDVAFFNIKATGADNKEYTPVKNSMQDQNIQVKQVKAGESYQIDLTYQIDKGSALQIKITDMNGNTLSNTTIA